jgi:hypothetical protein
MTLGVESLNILQTLFWNTNSHHVVYGQHVLLKDFDKETIPTKDNDLEYHKDTKVNLE